MLHAGIDAPPPDDTATWREADEHSEWKPGRREGSDPYPPSRAFPVLVPSSCMCFHRSGVANVYSRSLYSEPVPRGAYKDLKICSFLFR